MKIIFGLDEFSLKELQLNTVKERNKMMDKNGIYTGLIHFDIT